MLFIPTNGRNKCLLFKILVLGDFIRPLLLYVLWTMGFWVTIFGFQYFIERGLCHREREMELDLLVGEPWLRKTGDQWTPRGIYHSPPPPRALDRHAGCDWWGQDTSKQTTWLLDLKRRAPSVRFAGDQLPLGNEGDLHHQQEVGDHQQGLGEVSK